MNRTRIFKAMMSRILATVLSGLLIAQASLPAQASLAFPSAPFADLTPPSAAGTLTAAWPQSPAQRAPQVIIIQDLHFNYSVQKNIVLLLKFLSQKKVLGPTIAVEGAAGPINNSLLADIRNSRFRAELADVLMQNGELTGTQYYSAVTGQPRILQGIENADYFQANRQIFQKSYATRTLALKQVVELRQRLETLIPTVYSAPVKDLQRAQNRLEEDRLSLADFWRILSRYSQKLDVPQPAILTDYLSASPDRRSEMLMSNALYAAILEYSLAVETRLAQTRTESNLIQLLHEMELIERSLDQHTTLEEARYMARRIDQIPALINALAHDSQIQGRVDATAIQEALRASTDFYVAALMRNRPMLKNMLSLLPANRGKSTVWVVGGFHTAYIIKELTQKGISFAVLTPQVDRHSDADDELYVKRYLGVRMTTSEMLETIAAHGGSRAAPRWFEGAGLVPDPGGLPAVQTVANLASRNPGIESLSDPVIQEELARQVPIETSLTEAPSIQPVDAFQTRNWVKNSSLIAAVMAVSAAGFVIAAVLGSAKESTLTGIILSGLAALYSYFSVISFRNQSVALGRARKKAFDIRRLGIRPNTEILEKYKAGLEAQYHITVIDESANDQPRDMAFVSSSDDRASRTVHIDLLAFSFLPASMQDSILRRHEEMHLQRKGEASAYFRQFLTFGLDRLLSRGVDWVPSDQDLIQTGEEMSGHAAVLQGAERHKRQWESMRRVYDRLIKISPPRIKWVIQSAWSTAQAKGFEDNVNPDIYPAGTNIVAVADPQPTPGSLSLARASGNGLGVMGIMKDFMARFVREKNLSPGRYNLYDLLGSDMVSSIFGGGKASRSHESTEKGKFAGRTPIVRRSQTPGEPARPATLEELLAVQASVLADVFPKTVSGHASGGYLLLYGDAIVTVDPDKLADFFRSNPNIPEGFTLILRSVPYQESILWGCAAVDNTGRIIKFSEKPGLAILNAQNPAYVELLRWLLEGSVPETELQERARALGTTMEKIQSDLKEGLKQESLLIDNNYILMNTAIGIAGTGALIRLLQIAGVAIENNGDFTVTTRGTAPMLSGDSEGVILKAQGTLASLLSDNAPRAGDYAYSVAPIKGQLAEFEENRNGPNESVTAAENILLKLAEFLAQSPKSEIAQQAILRAIHDLGQNVSVLDRTLRDGGEVDAMGHFANKMASQSDVNEIFKEAVAVLKTAGEGNLSIPERDWIQVSLNELIRLRDEMIHTPPSVFNDNSLEKHLALAYFHYLPHEGDPVRLAIYRAFALARRNQLIWQILRKDGPGRGAFGAVVDGEWFDTGATDNILKYFLQDTIAGARIAKVFDFKNRLFSVGGGHGYDSYIAQEHGDFIHPDSLQIGTQIAGNLVLGDPYLDIEENTGIFNSNIPWRFHLYEGSVIVEGVLKQDPQKDQSYVVHSLWQAEADPGKFQTYFGEPLTDWLRGQGIDPNWVLTPQAQKKPTLFAAKLFPGISLPLLEAARRGLTGEALRAAAKDELDYDLLMNMSSIWKWLQHQTHDVPPEWIAAAKAGRLFSMSDQYDQADFPSYLQMQRGLSAEIETAVESPRRVTAEESAEFGLGLRRVAFALLSAGVLLMGEMVMGIAIPWVAPVAVVGIGLYANTGGQLLLRQSDALRSAKELAQAANPDGSGIVAPPTDAQLEDFELVVLKRYGNVTFADAAHQSPPDAADLIYYQNGATHIDNRLVAYYLNRLAPDVFHSIMEFHEPLHAWTTKEWVALGRQAYMAPVTSAFQKTNNPLATLLAPIFLILSLIDQGVALVVTLFIGTKVRVDPEILASMNQKDVQIAGVLEVVSRTPPTASRWWTSILSYWRKSTATGQAFDEAAARASLSAA